ncbi:MAG: hypothetical protein LBM74_04695 [Oscillospiraceae bacterium]|jgi:hypothetical protein|nr:hypothetical protein [Oscillospiraceae bacterium]
MKKLSLMMAMPLVLTLLLTACQAPVPTDVPPTDPPAPTSAPTYVMPTMEPTIAPREMEGEIEEPSPNATPLMIYPADMPPLTFTYIEVEEPGLGVSFDVPQDWVRESPESNAVIYLENPNNIQSRTQFQSSLTITMTSRTNEQTMETAKSYLDDKIAELREQFPDLEVSPTAENPMMNSKGVYVTYWLGQPYPDNPEQTFRMRGRLLIVPVGTKLYQLRYMCPADFNTGYEMVFRNARSTMKEL